MRFAEKSLQLPPEEVRSKKSWTAQLLQKVRHISRAYSSYILSFRCDFQQCRENASPVITQGEGWASLLAWHCKDSSLPPTALQSSCAGIISCLSSSFMVLCLLNTDHEAAVLYMPTVFKVDIFHNPTNKQWSYSFKQTVKSQKVTMQCLCQNYTYLFIDVHSCIGSVCPSQFINKAALFFMVYGNSLFYVYKIGWIKWIGMNLRLLQSTVTFLEIHTEAWSTGCLRPLSLHINKTALFLRSVVLLLDAISEFMNFSLRCHPGGVSATVSLFKVKWNSLLLLKQMNSMFTCLYYLPPPLSCSSTGHKQTAQCLLVQQLMGRADSRRYLEV